MMDRMDVKSRNVETTSSSRGHSGHFGFDPPSRTWERARAVVTRLTRCPSAWMA